MDQMMMVHAGSYPPFFCSFPSLFLYFDFQKERFKETHCKMRDFHRGKGFSIPIPCLILPICFPSSAGYNVSVFDGSAPAGEER